MRKQKLPPIWESAWSNHILNAAIGIILLIGLVYFSKSWGDTLFWVYGILAVLSTFTFVRIPKRFNRLKGIALLTFITIAITLGKAEINYYLLMSAIIFLITFELIEHFDDKRKKQREEGYWH